MKGLKKREELKLPPPFFLRDWEMELRNTEGFQIHYRDNINNRNSTASLYFPLNVLIFGGLFFLLQQQQIT